MPVSYTHLDVYKRQAQGHIDLSRLEVFVLDEADRMLDMGFVHDVKRVVARLPQKRQTLLFSATMPAEIRALAQSLLHSPVYAQAAPPATTVEAIEQCVCFVDKGNKKHLLARLLREPEVDSALVFTRTKHGANRVVKELAAAGMEAMAIHGNKSQTARQPVSYTHLDVYKRQARASGPARPFGRAGSLPRPAQG